jgi:DNA polymerase-3 subunit epsilon
MNAKNKIYFDLETTGFDGIKHDIIEIYMLKEATNGEILDNLHIYFNPQKPLPSSIIEITSLTDKFLLDKPNFKSQVDKIINFIGEDDILIGHNAKSFDIVFLNDQFKKHNILNKEEKVFQLKNNIEDTMIMAREIDNVDKYTKGYKLVDLAKRFKLKIDEKKFHGAKYDVEITRELYKIFNSKR